MGGGPSALEFEQLFLALGQTFPEMCKVRLRELEVAWGGWTLLCQGLARGQHTSLPETAGFEDKLCS